jgi:hypothetical protein
LRTIVEEANRFIVCAGSRSRDEDYLMLIEDKLQANPAVVYYRILFGPPHFHALHEHLLRVLQIRDPQSTAREGAGKSVFISLFDDHDCEPEHFLCGNERCALLPQLSLRGLSWYDTAFLVNDVHLALMWASRMQEAYHHGHPVETREDVLNLPILKGDRDDRPLTA